MQNFFELQLTKLDSMFWQQFYLDRGKTSEKQTDLCIKYLCKIAE